MKRFPDKVILDVSEYLPKIRECIVQLEDVTDTPHPTPNNIQFGSGDHPLDRREGPAYGTKVDLEISELEYATDYYLDNICCQLLTQDEALANLLDYKSQILTDERRHGNDGARIAEYVGQLGLQLYEVLRDHELYHDNHLHYFYSGRVYDSVIILLHDDCHPTPVFGA